MNNEKDNFNVNKKSAGRYLTEGDPFEYEAFKEWITEACLNSETICEPYAGKNNLLYFAYNRYADLLQDKKFFSFDVTPCSKQDNRFPSSEIIKANTLFNIPQDNIDIIISNPPYLARNSARRQKLDFPFDYDGQGIARPSDLYQICLDTALKQAKYVCFLIPESFITSKYDKSRLSAVISLRGDLFSDTEMPVCLALFVPQATKDYKIIKADGATIGKYSEISKINEKILCYQQNPQIKFNRRDGQIGLRGLDDTKSASIRFCDKSEIPADKVKTSSRGLTRIYSPLFDELTSQQLNDLIVIANRILNEWRIETSDLFLTAFKGIRKDGSYRRRLSYDIANRLLVAALEELTEN